MLSYDAGYGIITKIKEGSVAADHSDLGIGDLLVSMNGHILYPAKRNGEKEIMSIWRKYRRKEKPCQLTVIKPRCPATRGVFAPLRSILHQYQNTMDKYYSTQKEKIEEKLREAEEEKAKSLAPAAHRAGMMSVAESTSDCGRYPVCYIGEVFIGECGGMGEIQQIIKTAVAKQSPTTTVKVILEITEIGVLVKRRSQKPNEARNSGDSASIQTLLESKKNSNCVGLDMIDESEIEKMSLSMYSDDDANNLIFTHKFADISSCGKIVTDEKHFCYIAGDTFCTISRQFHGYVFSARSLSQAKLILNSIYQGFKRTTFFM